MLIKLFIPTRNFSNSKLKNWQIASPKSFADDVNVR